MRKQFLLLLTALLTLGAASVKAETTVSFTNSLKGDVCGYEATTSKDDIGLSMMCVTANGAQISGETPLRIYYNGFANNVITRVVFRVVSEANGGVSAMNHTYTREGDVVTISGLEALMTIIVCPYTENPASFIIDSLAVTYDETENSIITLSYTQDGWAATVDNVTILSTYYSGAAYIDPGNNFYVTISSTEGNVPDMRCYIFDGTAAGKAGLTASSGTLTVNGNWAILTGATSNTVTITSSAPYVAFQYFVLGAGGSTPSGSTEQVDVIYQGKDEAQLSTEEITLNLPAAPEITGFTFNKWVVIASDLEDGIIIRAAYTENTPTNAPVVTVPGNPAQKLVREGNIYILQDDKLYNMQGQLVK